jgi:hypothetical protein
MRTIELGVTITDAAVDGESTTIFCTPVTRDPRCPDCGREGRYRDTVIRPLTDLPVAGVSAGVAGCRTPLPLRHHRLRSHSVQSRPGQAGSTSVVDDTALCPVCVAAVVD